jgi:hypothetical protein
MPITETQLATWSHIGSITQSSSTYATIKRALESPTTGYAGKSYRVFLQGSYGNDTNIYAESDVDVVIVLDDLVNYDTSRLLPDQATAVANGFFPAMYDYSAFKRDVLTALRSSFGNNIQPGSKAIPIPAGGGRRSADVIVAIQQRRYLPPVTILGGPQYIEGITFLKGGTQWVENYPKQHSTNMTTKHQATGNRLKPLVRVFKNTRNRLYSEGLLTEGYAPSYYIEGMLYNVPTYLLAGTLQQQFIAAYNWLNGDADRSNLLCANKQFYLLRNGSETCWAPNQFEAFLRATSTLWARM